MAHRLPLADYRFIAKDGPVATLLRRALPYFAAGRSAEDSLRAVLADDERLFAALLDRGSSTYFPTPDERGVSRYSGDRKGDVIASELARLAYSRLRVVSA